MVLHPVLRAIDAGAQPTGHHLETREVLQSRGEPDAVRRRHVVRVIDTKPDFGYLRPR